MKKLFILAVLALTVAGTAAAATKSSSKKSASAKENGLFMGGSMGFTFTNISSNGDGQSGVSFKLVADGGYNFNKTFGIGAQLGYAHGVAALGGFDITDVKALASTMVGGMVDAGSKNLSINGFTMAPYARITLFGGKTVKFFIEPTFSFSLASIVKLEETGLADKIGDDDDDEVFIGRDLAHAKAHSEAIAGEIDREVKQIIDQCYTRAKELILEHEQVLHSCAALLLEKEKIGRDEFEALFCAK